MLVWTIIGAFAVVAGGLIGYVAWRDRRRSGSTEDAVARAAARDRMERYEADRNAVQGLNWQEGHPGDGH